MDLLMCQDGFGALDSKYHHHIHIFSTHYWYRGCKVFLEGTVSLWKEAFK